MHVQVSVYRHRHKYLRKDIQGSLAYDRLPPSYESLFPRVCWREVRAKGMTPEETMTKRMTATRGRMKVRRGSLIGAAQAATVAVAAAVVAFAFASELSAASAAATVKSTEMRHLQGGCRNMIKREYACIRVDQDDINGNMRAYLYGCVCVCVVEYMYRSLCAYIAYATRKRIVYVRAYKC